MSVRFVHRPTRRRDLISSHSEPATPVRLRPVGARHLGPGAGAEQEVGWSRVASSRWCCSLHPPRPSLGDLACGVVVCQQRTQQGDRVHTKSEPACASPRTDTWDKRGEEDSEGKGT